jgi:hypothetical protein
LAAAAKRSGADCTWLIREQPEGPDLFVTIRSGGRTRSFQIRGAAEFLDPTGEEMVRLLDLEFRQLLR